MFKAALTITIPTLCIYYFISNLEARTRYSYAEKFGDGEHYLDLYFGSHPHGPLTRLNGENRFRFEGRLVHQGGEEEVRGIRYLKAGIPVYEFGSSLGQFQGVLRPARSSCEPEMQYVVTRSGNGSGAHVQGTLRAGFCDSLTR